MVTFYRKGVRKHGCQCPWNCQQTLSYLLFIINCACFYFIEFLCFTSTNYEHQAVLVAIVYAVLAILTAFYTIAATVTDPTDETIYI